MNNKGITLIEITIATLILASVVVPISSLMGFGGKATTKDAKRIAAIQILDKTMRQILAQPFSEIANITKKTETKHNSNICDNKILLGTVYSEVNPGKSGNGFKFDVELRTIFKPVSFSYKPIEVWKEGFDEKKPKLKYFGNTETISLDKSVIELKLIVKWEENKNKVTNSISAKSYMADLSRKSIYE